MQVTFFVTLVPRLGASFAMSLRGGF